MKRRHFIKGIGMSSAALAGGAAYAADRGEDIPDFEEYTYPAIKTLADACSQEGDWIIRFELSGDLPEGSAAFADRIRTRNTGQNRIRTYFFDRIAVLWVREVEEASRITLSGRERFSFELGDLVARGEITGKLDGVGIKAHFLLDREIGEISLSQLRIEDPGDTFSFVAMADPQGGLPDDKETLKTRMKIHNAFIQESVDLANNLEFDPLFAMVIGDVCDDWGYKKDLAQMNRFLSGLPCPVLYEIGNHETLLRARFEPGYNMDAFNNFLGAQKAMNGLEKLLYSFNAGGWHFIIWPDPLRDNFWETHPHYFDWLERDLEKHRERPAMVFQHVPSHPTGISPHINYAESVYVKRTFLNILARHGNVKYVLSGHVHIPVRASFKTAVSYRGMKLINLPAAGYRPRAFGEEDFYGGPSQGIALVHIAGDSARIQFKTVTEEVFDYPHELPGFDEVSYGLWLKYSWELPAGYSFINSDFNQGLDGWTRRFVYREEHHPSHLCEVRSAPDNSDKNVLYLFCQRRGYQAPGQDRLPQDINRICQAISIIKGMRPVIRFRYRIDGSVTTPRGYSGGYAWIEGFSGSQKRFNLVYSAGKIWVNIGGKYARLREYPPIQMGLSEQPDIWHDAALNIASDYEKTESGVSWAALQVDRLVIHFGVWNLNDGEEHPFGIYFTDLSQDYRPDESSHIGGEVIVQKPKEDEWWRNKLWPWKNIAGEHRYVISTQPPNEHK